MITLPGTILNESKDIVVSLVETDFLRILESEVGSFCAIEVCPASMKRSKRYIPVCFKPFLLVMVKITIYCAVQGLKRKMHRYIRSRIDHSEMQKGTRDSFLQC